MTSHVGFTGVSRPLTYAQHQALSRVVADLPETTIVHHGGCVGADAEFHRLALDRDLRIHVWPSTIAVKQARLPGGVLVTVHPPDAPLVRDDAIVAHSDRIIACPGRAEYRRAGDWYTVRVARRTARPVTIVWPDGEVSEDDGTGQQPRRVSA